MPLAHPESHRPGRDFLRAVKVRVGKFLRGDWRDLLAGGAGLAIRFVCACFDATSRAFAGWRGGQAQLKLTRCVLPPRMGSRRQSPTRARRLSANFAEKRTVRSCAARRVITQGVRFRPRLGHARKGAIHMLKHSGCRRASHVFAAKDRKNPRSRAPCRAWSSTVAVRRRPRRPRPAW